MWMFIVKIVRKIERATIWIVKTRYLPRRGTTKEVGGIISRNGRKNRVNLKLNKKMVLKSSRFRNFEC